MLKLTPEGWLPPARAVVRARVCVCVCVHDDNLTQALEHGFHSFGFPFVPFWCRPSPLVCLDQTGLLVSRGFELR
eukprot:SAG22_NODE_4340_length_1298_cov_1.441201_1_plen_74_part_10